MTKRMRLYLVLTIVAVGAVSGLTPTLRAVTRSFGGHRHVSEPGLAATGHVHFSPQQNGGQVPQALVGVWTVARGPEDTLQLEFTSVQGRAEWRDSRGLIASGTVTGSEQNGILRLTVSLVARDSSKLTFVIDGRLSADRRTIVGEMTESGGDGRRETIRLVAGSGPAAAGAPGASAGSSPARAPSVPDRPWFVQAIDIASGAERRVDETEVYHASSSCPALKGRKIEKSTRKNRQQYRVVPRVACRECRPTSDKIASADLWRINAAFDRTHAQKIHTYYENNQHVLLQELQESPGLSEMLFHFDRACPLVDATRIYHTVKFSEYEKPENALMQLCPFCRQRLAGRTPKQLVEIDTLAEYRAEKGLAPRDRAADIAALIGALGNVAAIAAGGSAAGPTSAPLPSAAGGSGSTSTNRQCNHSLSSSGMYSTQTHVFPSAGGILEVRVQIPAGCGWRLIREGELSGGWVSHSALSGSGPGRITFTAGPFAPQPGAGPETRTVPFTFQNLSSPDFSHDFRVAQCDASIPLNSCGGGVSTSR